LKPTGAAYHRRVPPPLRFEFVMSAPSVTKLPETMGEVALAGRSNVGKSSLVNALANRNGLAATSKTPGRTQMLNLFTLPDGRTLVDLPGYGYAKAPASARQRWAKMIEAYLTQRDGLVTVVALIDGEVGPTKLDLDLLDWLEHIDRPYRIVATKADKVGNSKRQTRRRDLAEKCGVEVGDVLWVSAAKGTNIDLLRTELSQWMIEPDDGD